MTFSPVPIAAQQASGDVGVGDITCRPEPLKYGNSGVEVFFSERACTRSRHQTTDGQVAERSEVALTEQVEQRRALRVIVVRLRGAAAMFVQGSPQPQVLGPGRRCAPGIELIGDGGEARLGLVEPICQRPALRRR